MTTSSRPANIKKLKQEYQKQFDGPHGRIVLSDLIVFCRGVSPTATYPDKPGVSALLDGRREALLRILEFAQVPESDMWFMAYSDESLDSQVGAEVLARRSQAYKCLFLAEDSDAMRSDLGEFCFARTSTASIDFRDAFRMAGRREVWLRIQQHVQLSVDQLCDLFGSTTGRLTTTPQIEDNDNG